MSILLILFIVGRRGDRNDIRWYLRELSCYQNVCMYVVLGSRIEENIYNFMCYDNKKSHCRFL